MSFPPPGVTFASDFFGPDPVIYEPSREVHQVVTPVVGVLVQKVPSVRQLAVPDGFILNEQFAPQRSFACTQLAGFGHTQLDAIPLIFLPFDCIRNLLLGGNLQRSIEVIRLNLLRIAKMMRSTL